MKLFKKRGVKTIDFTKSQNISVPKVSGKMNLSGDCVDLREQTVSVQPSSVSSASVGSSGSVIDFLSSGSSNVSSSNTSTSSFSSESNQSNEIIGIKKIMRNLSTKSEDNSNELYRLTQKIELLEKKIERLESGRV